MSFSSPLPISLSETLHTYVYMHPDLDSLGFKARFYGHLTSELKILHAYDLLPVKIVMLTDEQARIMCLSNMAKIYCTSCASPLCQNGGMPDVRHVPRHTARRISPQPGPTSVSFSAHAEKSLHD